MTADALLADQPLTVEGASRRVVRRLAGVGVATLASVGLVLRLWALGRQPVNSDEAVVGLMARQILHGHTYAFYWGQHYGGVEPYVVAAFFALFGQSSFTLGIVPVVLDAVAALLVWRIGRRLFGPEVGVGAALLFWVWPEVYVWQSTLEYGFRWAALVLCLAALLVALRVVDPRPRPGALARSEWLALGVLAGLGWWATPEVVYYLLPAAVVVLVELVRRRVRARPVDVALAAAGAVLGALPWLWDNVPGFASLHLGVQPDPSVASHGNILRLHVLPMMLGLQLPVSGRFLVGTDAGMALEYAAVLAGVVWLVTLVRRRQALVLVVFTVAFPFLYALSPVTWYWQDGRYGVFFAPVAALLATSGACALAERLRALPGRRSPADRRAGAAVLAVLAGLGLTLAAVAQVAPFTPARADPARATWTTWHADPLAFLLPVARALEARGARRVYTGYWLAYTLTFESKGAVVASDALPAYVRYAPYLAAVRAAARPAWLFANPSAAHAAAVATGLSLVDPGCAAKTDRCLEPGELEAWLTAHRIAYRVLPLHAFLAVLVERRFDPAPMLAAYHVGPLPRH
ncbi:MAG TPA: glycosyltransferase family 39 protein [Acidimicrobiales bacterium]|nr:glycosyltransferase family 39 protein [Acidimicrobiales bacterium]